MSGMINFDNMSFCETGKQHFSRTDVIEPIRLNEKEYVDMLDDVVLEITKMMNQYKQKYYKDGIQLTTSNIKIFLSCLTPSQKEECKKRKEEEEEKLRKKNEFFERIKKEVF